jgi:hypothetical protein
MRYLLLALIRHDALGIRPLRYLPAYTWLSARSACDTPPTKT